MKLSSSWSRLAGLVFGLALCACAGVPPVLREPPPGVRLGVVVARLNGETLVSRRGGERFIPASNTKLFTAAAAFHRIPGLDVPDPGLGTSLIMMPGQGAAPPSLGLVGHGDPALADASGCVANCLGELAAAVAASGITLVGDVYADGSAFADEPWGMGWSWNNLPFYFGAPVSALAINANAVSLRVAPGQRAGDPVTADWLEGDALLGLNNTAVTSAPGSEDRLSVMRWPGSDEVQVTGSLPASSPPRNLALSVADPEAAAAGRLVRLLSARGVTVTGEAKAWTSTDPPTGQEIARLSAPALLASVTAVSKDSDNLYAEMLLRHIASAAGRKGAEAGLDSVHAMLDEAGIGRAEVELFDGSGLSPYNRITPSATVRFLTWTASQPWGGAFRETLPVGGRDGSLAGRFKSTALEGRVFAKTGTVQGVNALSGFLIAASGETLVFSVIANDRPSDSDPVIPVIDAMLLDIAARY